MLPVQTGQQRQQQRVCYWFYPPLSPQLLKLNLLHFLSCSAASLRLVPTVPQLLGNFLWSGEGGGGGG